MTTPLERLIELKQWAWKELNGWEFDDEDGFDEFKSRLRCADRLVDWLLKPPE